MNELSARQQKELCLLSSFIGLFCRSRHGRESGAPLPAELSLLVGKEQRLCPDCAGLLEYSARRLRSCPMKPKPLCKKCPVHCYRPDYRQRIREVMAWSGKRLILRGRLDLLFHYFF